MPTGYKEFQIPPNALWCIHNEIPSVIMHRHNFLEIEYVASGSAMQMMNGKSYAAGPGFISLARLSDVHSWHVRDGEICEVYKVQVVPSRLPDELLQKLDFCQENLITVLPEEDRPFALETCRFLIRLMETQAPGKSDLLESLVQALICLLLRAGNQPELAESRAGEISKYIRAHFKEKLTLEDIATRFFFNKNYLCTYFKERTGVTLLAYIRQVRLEYAARLVVTTQMSSNQIYKECGYSSLCNFLRDFSKRYGVSPMTMRANTVCLSEPIPGEDKE